MAMTFGRQALIKTGTAQGDQYLAANFTFAIAGVSEQGAVSVDGLNWEHEVVIHKDGDTNVQRCRPGLMKPSTFTIMREDTHEKSFRMWRQSVIDGSVDRRSCTVQITDDAGAPKITIDLFNCWPTEYIMPNMTSNTSANALEGLVITYEEMKITFPG